MFVLVDCNNFFVSCERVFNPKLSNVPVVVLSNNEGCVVARSNEVKDLGVPMGAPYFQCRDLFKKNKVRVFSSNFKLYGDLSQRLIQVLSQLTCDIEVYSVDEAFLKMSDKPDFDWIAWGLLVRKKILKELGLPVSIGIAPTKTLTKVAAEFIKKTKNKDGVLLLNHPNQTDPLLAKLPVEDIWGIGRKSAAKLKAKGIDTAFDFKNLSEAWVRRVLTVQGLRTQAELKGVSCLALESLRATKHTLIYSRSFEKTLTHKKDLKEVLAHYVSKAFEKLRAEKLATHYLCVFSRTKNRTNSFDVLSHYYKWASPTQDTHEAIKAAFLIWEAIYKEGLAYKKMGVMLGELVPEHCVQSDLFESLPHVEQSKKLMKAMDSLNQKYKDNLVHYASFEASKIWHAPQKSKSPEYTTKWSDLPVVKA